MTPEQMLKEILDVITPVRKPTAHRAKVTVLVPSDRPPLIVPDSPGRWLLVEWVQILNEWKFEYQYQKQEYYIEARCVGQPPAELEDTRTTNHDKACEMLQALNIGVDQNYGPFSLRRVE